MTDTPQPPASEQANSCTTTWVAPLLAIGVTMGFFAVLILLLLRPEPASGVATTLLGALGAAWVSVISYHFGSSAGSQLKTRLLAERAPEGITVNEREPAGPTRK